MIPDPNPISFSLPSPLPHRRLHSPMADSDDEDQLLVDFLESEILSDPDAQVPLFLFILQIRVSSISHSNWIGLC